MTKPIDLDYRPKTFFRPHALEKYLLSKVKGAVLRRKLTVLFEEGRYEEASNLLAQAVTTPEELKALEAIHPMFMGGNYLPDTEEGEVEIARISIKSTTFDVTCVYARADGGSNVYRVVDEYNGETLASPTETRLDRPMSLGEFADFFLRAWPLMEVLEMNFEDDVEGALDFFSPDSEFYGDLDRLCRLRVRQHFPETEVEEEDDNG